MLELARSEYVARRENIIALGNSGTGKTHIALGLGRGSIIVTSNNRSVVHQALDLVVLERKLEAYREYYNQHRCHTGLAGLTPAQ